MKERMSLYVCVFSNNVCMLFLFVQHQLTPPPSRTHTSPFGAQCWILSNSFSLCCWILSTSFSLGAARISSSWNSIASERVERERERGREREVDKSE